MERGGIYMLQILVSELKLSNFPEILNLKKVAIFPKIIFQVRGLPLVDVSFLSNEEIGINRHTSTNSKNELPLNIEKSYCNSGCFNFKKGKSCLFFKPSLLEGSFLIKISLEDERKGRKLGEVLVESHPFKRYLVGPQMILSDLLILKDRYQSIFCSIEMTVIMQFIGSNRSNEELYQTASSKLNKYRKEARYRATDINNKETVRSKHLQFNEINTLRIKRTKDVNMSIMEKGWLRSTPLYKGVPLESPKSRNTRSSFLKLMNINSDLRFQLDKEIDRKMGENVLKMEKELQMQIGHYKLNRKRHNLRPRTALLVKNVSQQTEATILINQGTSTHQIVTEHEKVIDETLKNSVESLNLGDRVYNDFEPVKIEDIAVNEDSKSSKTHHNSVDREQQAYVFNEEESIEITEFLPEDMPLSYKIALLEESLHSDILSSSESDGASSKDSIIMSENESISQHIEAYIEERLSTVAEEEIFEEGEQIEEDCEIADSNNSLVDNFFQQNNTGIGRDLNNSSTTQDEGSKGLPFKQGQRNNLEQKQSTRSPTDTEDVESTISDMSAKIAALLMPKNIDRVSLNTDSVSSYLPSNSVDISLSDLS